MATQGSSASGVVAGSSMSDAGGSKVNKNAPGSRTDIAWKYGVSIDGNPRKLKCKFCEKVITGGVYRLKHHLAGTQKDVGACRAVSEEVKKQMLGIVCSLQQALLKKSIDYVEASTNEDVGDAEKGKRQAEVGIGGHGNIFKKRGVSSQATINNIFKKELREEACQEISSFFYNNAIPFNVAKSSEYQKMFELVARHGQGFKPPSYHDIRVKYLKQKVEHTTKALELHKAHWKETGCSIMTDGWTDKRRRTILNFLVNSSMGTVFLKSVDASHISKTAEKIFQMLDEVVEEIGEENIVQVVTDNAANYKAAGEMLMEKRKRLYWTPCAAHCIDLMLEDFEKKIPVHKETIASGKKITAYIYSRTLLISLLQQCTNGKDLVRPAVTRFATAYLSLGCLNDNRRALMKMFTSNEWSSSQFAKTKDGKLVHNLVMDQGFWKNVIISLKGAFPLIRVLRLVDSDEKPAMGYIYEEMDKAKEKIQSNFNGVRKSYMPLWEIIDERWDRQLHRPLHAAGYYLNPQMHYSDGFKADFEVKRGLYDCLQRMVENVEEMTKIDVQLEDFKRQAKFFGSVPARNTLHAKTPAQWWESYGDEHPELKKFAIRVLSLTCSSSGCERNWSAFEMVHTKRRNRLKQKTMNDVVFVMANSKLAKKKKARKETGLYEIDDLSSDDDWIVDNDGVGENDEDDNVNLAEIGQESDAAAAAPSDDLEIANHDDFDELDGEDEDHLEDDYYDQNLNDVLDI